MKKWIYRTLVIMIFTLLGNHVARCNQHIPIAYDKNHVAEFYDGAYRELTLVKVYEIEDLKIHLYTPAGGWSTEPGNFRRIEIKFKNGKSFILNNHAVWMDIVQPSKSHDNGLIASLKLPAKSDKVAVYPHFIKLDMGKGASILLLFGRPQAPMPGFLTLLYIAQNKAEVIFNKHVDLVEIEETLLEGYRLVGTVASDLKIEKNHLGIYRLVKTRLGDPEPTRNPYSRNPWEILIENQKLSFKDLPFKKLYTHQNPALELYDCIGWGHHKQPGDFTRIKPTDGKQVTLDHYYAFWRKLDPHIKLPKNSQRIQRSPYFIVLDKALYHQTTLVLYGCDCPEYDDGLPYLSLVKIYSGNTSYPIYIGAFKLEEIIETENGYRLIGKRITKDGQEQYCEKIIENGELIDSRENS